MDWLETLQSVSQWQWIASPQSLGAGLIIMPLMILWVRRSSSQHMSDSSHNLITCMQMIGSQRHKSLHLRQRGADVMSII